MVKVAFKFAWYDIWIGLFVDNKKKDRLILYFCPLPTLLITVMIHHHVWIYSEANRRVECGICQAEYRRMKKWQI